MKFYLFLAFFASFGTLGYTLKCYLSMESDLVNTARLETECKSSCGIGNLTLDEGVTFIVRGCSDTYEEFKSSDFIKLLPKEQQKAFSKVIFNPVEICNQALCNGGNSILSSLLWLSVGLVIAIFAIN